MTTSATHIPLPPKQCISVRSKTFPPNVLRASLFDAARLGNSTRKQQQELGGKSKAELIFLFEYSWMVPIHSGGGNDGLWQIIDWLLWFLASLTNTLSINRVQFAFSNMSIEIVHEFLSDFKQQTEAIKLKAFGRNPNAIQTVICDLAYLSCCHWALEMCHREAICTYSNINTRFSIRRCNASPSDLQNKPVHLTVDAQGPCTRLFHYFSVLLFIIHEICLESRFDSIYIFKILVREVFFLVSIE